MTIDILSLFPSYFDGFISESIIKRAIDNDLVKINIIDFRKYSDDKHHKVDDTPYGGGAGMVLAVPPIYKALEDIKTKDSHIILLTPSAKVFKQSDVYRLNKYKHLILICGRYEGFDERVRELADEELSIGDFVLTGGEVPAMAISDAVIRSIKGVINEESFINDSFTENSLDYPVYTKPQSFMGMDVPDILISGDHAKIATWRKEAAYKKTKEIRPDLGGKDV